MPVEWEIDALHHARAAAAQCADPDLRQRIIDLVYCIRWCDYLAALRARHVNWALAVHDGHLGPAIHLLFRYPATERAYYRARVLNLIARAMRDSVTRLKQLHQSPVGQAAPPAAGRQAGPSPSPSTPEFVHLEYPSPQASFAARLRRLARPVCNVLKQRLTRSKSEVFPSYLVDSSSRLPRPTQTVPPPPPPRYNGPVREEFAMRNTAILIMILAAPLVMSQTQTRGLGIYPGDPREDFAPTSRIDAATYRNLALHRAAFHSSSYDYNLTAQLATDGIRHSTLPRFIATGSSEKPVLDKHEREWLLDDNWISSVNLKGPQVWVQAGFLGGPAPLSIDRIDVDARLNVRTNGPEGWLCVVSSSDDGQSWQEVGRVQNSARPKREFLASVPIAPSTARYYRVELTSGAVSQWRIGEITPYFLGEKLRIAGPYQFTSAWMSAGAAEEWIAVDLGAVCTFDKLNLHWIRRAAAGSIQTSDDNAKWTTLLPLPPEAGEIRLAAPAKARYVRLLLTKAASPEGYVLSELEVWGRGGPVWRPKPQPALQPGGRLTLSGGAWKLQRDNFVQADGHALSRPGFADASWLPATVPGTTLTSYFNAGAVPDPNFSDNQLMISDSFFQSDFWYRDEFVAPPSYQGRRAWLNFDGINWKADVYLNGEKIGRIEGGFTRARFDVTGKIHPGQRNALAVRVEKNATTGSVKEKTFQAPDMNGGALGADNPTYHASIGWDWIPTIRGRNTGIWNDVFLAVSGDVTLADPLVVTKLPLPDTSRAGVTVEVVAKNNSGQPVEGTLRGRLGPHSFERKVTLAPGETRAVSSTIAIDHPRLWWPAGYGNPDLYDVELKFETGQSISDTKSFQAGVRQFTFSEEGGALRIWINGRRFIPRGGNWGFSESMLRYRGREYDAAVRYHRDLNFTMIRNWVGMIGDDEFYEACDRHGIVVWQDFWLANPVDGPDPDDNFLFMRNARDLIGRIRHHASIGLYCGRNEGFPPPYLNVNLQLTVAEMHPDMHYIGSSADDVVSGHGPYRAMPFNYYFTQRATPLFHSEMGMPNIVTWESLNEFMKPEDMWPQGRVWGLHDFCLTGAQGGSSFRDLIDKRYGGAKDAREWVNLAQFVNYEGHRAMFEAQSKYRMGLLIWMSHPTWPSFVWQTYDYYLEPTAGYFGAKKANEPLHIQWNPLNNAVEVVNYSAGANTGLTASAAVLALDGAKLWEKSATLDSPEDSVNAPFTLEFPSTVTPVHFIRLELYRGAQLVSENFYWRGAKEGDNTALRTLPKVKLDVATTAARKGEVWNLTTQLRNNTKTPAILVRLKAVREKAGDRILPALYSDNYVSLMPGDTRVITTELNAADARGEHPAMRVEGLNLD